MLFLDLETRSEVDLVFHGLARYAESETTEVICMAYAFEDKSMKFWWADEPFPAAVKKHFKKGGLITAHNADFERYIFNHVISRTHNVPPPKLTQWRCSMAMGLTNGYAGGLGTLAVTLGLSYRKHADGTRLIREYCAPGHLKEFKQGDAERMKQYNIDDVEVMRAAVKCLRPLTEEEWEEYALCCRINDKGIPVDISFCEAAVSYSRVVAEEVSAKLAALTGGTMTRHTQRKARDAWLMPKLTQRHIDMAHKTGTRGKPVFSLDVNHRRSLLDCDDLDPQARELLELINDGGTSTLVKFSVAANQHIGGRVFNNFLWNGAGRTGRFSGRGLQPHNIRRDIFAAEEAENLIGKIKNKGEIDNPSSTLARLLRAMITHEAGLAWVDWKSIEGRIAPWLSDNPWGEEKLDLYRADKDVYVVTAADMFHRPESDIDATLRQSGKIAELSLQFGGSHNALIGMAKNYGVSFEEEEAREIVTHWRRVNPWAEMIWDEYDQAIHSAVAHPGNDFQAGRVTYHSDGVNFLWCELPSERLLSYPKPKYEAYMTPWDEERIGVTYQNHNRMVVGDSAALRIHARGTMMFQHTVQAAAADCLREALIVADEAGLDIVGHVHDEIIIQGTPKDGEGLNKIMLEQPWWAGGLPIATGGVSWGKRYGK